MNLSIIIPNYNGQNLLPNCLKSILTATQKQNLSKYEIVLVDNNSSDNSLKICQEAISNKKNLTLKIIKNSQNLGFSKAVNQGITHSSYPLVLILNNDIILHQNWFINFDKNFKKYNHQNLAAFFGLILKKNKTEIESTGLWFNIGGQSENDQNGTIYKPECNFSPKKIWGASGACVVYKKSVLEKIGLFDEDFFAFGEDVDLSLRLKHLSYVTWFFPDLISYHHGGATVNKMGILRSYLSFRNWHYIIVKNYSLKEIYLNLFSIIKFRLHDLSYLLRSSYRTYGYLSLFYSPLILAVVYYQIIVKLPKMLHKRYYLNNLPNS